MLRAVLIGPPGSGKSSVGRELANRLHCDFFDSDSEIVTRVGKPISEIFLDDGEAKFRALEKQIVAELIQKSDGVLSLGGGSILDSDTQSLVRSARTSGVAIVYLHILLTTAVPRVGLNKDRPMLLLNPRQQWNSLMESRRPIYEELASLSYSTDDAKAEDVASLIMNDLLNKTDLE